MKKHILHCPDKYDFNFLIIWCAQQAQHLDSGLDILGSSLLWINRGGGKNRKWLERALVRNNAFFIQCLNLEMGVNRKDISKSIHPNDLSHSPWEGPTVSFLKTCSSSCQNVELSKSIYNSLSHTQTPPKIHQLPNKRAGSFLAEKEVGRRQQ